MQVASRYDWASNTWSPAVPVQATDASGIHQRVVVDGEGNATATWAERLSGGEWERWANRYDAVADAWGTAQRIEELSGDATDAGALTVDPHGNVTALWNQGGSHQRDIRANRYRAAEGQWGQAVRLETQEASQWHPEAGVDAQGNVIATWSMQDGPTIWINRFDATTQAWRGEQAINLDRDHRAVLPRIGVTPDGDAVVAWYQHDGDRYNVWTTRYDATSSTWEQAQLHPDAERRTSRPNIGVDQHGNAIVGWLSLDGVYSLRARRLDATTGTWEPPVNLEMDPGAVDRFDLAMSPDGAAVVAFQQLDVERDVWTVRVNALVGRP